MEFPEPIETEFSSPVTLTPELGRLALEETASSQHLANLIFLSYRFSQGGIGTQNRMLLYIEENFHPGLMSGERHEEVHQITHKTVGRYFLDQSLHPATAIPWEDDSPEASIKTELLVTNELAGLFERFTDRQQIAGFTSDLPGIAQSVIVMDTDYLKRPGGRAGDSKDMKIVVSPYRRDPYESLFIRHAVLGVSTNTVEFDAIFRNLSTMETMNDLDGYTIRQLIFVVDTYLDHHPDMTNNERIIGIRKWCAELLNGK